MTRPDTLTEIAAACSLELRHIEASERTERVLREQTITAGDLLAYEERMADNIEALRIGGQHESADFAEKIAARVVERVRKAGGA